MSVEIPIPKERNWYKVATISLSILTVAISFVSGIYFKRTDERQRRLDRVDQKIEKLLVQKEKLDRVPKVDVSLQTLAKSGLPETAFKSLTEIPAVLRIIHAGGDTARGITIEIISLSEITRFTPEPSVEQFTQSLDHDKKRLRLEIPQLRANSTIQGTITTADITLLKYDASVDQGRIADIPSQSTETPISVMSIEQVDELNASAFTSSNDIDKVVEELRQFYRQERSQSMFNGIPRSLPIIFTGFVPILIMLPVFFLRDFIRGKRGQELGNRIWMSKVEGYLKLGMPATEVEKLLGPPRRITIEDKDSQRVETWEYVPSASLFFGWQPDAFIKLKDGSVITVEYKEYGKDYH